jgi:hypothetical protein
VIRFCLRVLFTFSVSLAMCLLLLAASHQGEANRCHRLTPGSAAYNIYCEAGR